VLLMDERSARWTAMTRDVLHDELDRSAPTGSLTVLFVTHNVREASGSATGWSGVSSRRPVIDRVPVSIERRPRITRHRSGSYPRGSPTDCVRR